MKLYDCFPFLNELELLDLRLMTLNDMVDFFVLVEANKTHTGAPKEFIFEKNKDMFSEYLDKIIYVKVEDLPNYRQSDYWGPENFQRNCISRGLSAATIQDKLIISDIDEIPDPDIVVNYLGSPDPLLSMEQILYYYYVNCIQNQPWMGSILANYNPNVTPQQLRHSARGMGNGAPGITKAILNAGWHYSFMGGAEKIKYKVENIAESHMIKNSVGSVNEIKNKMETQADLWNRPDDYARKSIIDITVNKMAPKHISTFIKKYPHFFFGEFKNE